MVQLEYSFNKLFSLAVLSTATLSLVACGSAKFGFNDTAANDSPNTSQGSGGALCNPLDSSNIVSATGGLQGKYYYLDPSQPRYTNSMDYINNGHVGSTGIYLSQVNVPTRDYLLGFVNGNGTPLSANGQTLTEYFGLGLQSNILLGPNDVAGDYQFAMIVDDGATLSFASPITTTAGAGAPTYSSFLSDEGLNSSRMTCATSAISFDSSTLLPMFLSYYQGPRNYLTLMLLWRKVPNNPTASDLADVECGASGNNEFIDTSGNPTAAFTALQSRGWKVLGPANFELQSGYNKCI